MRRTLFAVLLLALLIGCGGGGGGPPPSYEPPPVALGLIAQNATSPFAVRVVNPFSAAATVTLTVATPGLSVASGQLPRQLPAGAETDLNVILSPAGAGTFDGFISFHVDTGTQTDEQQTDVSASIEATTASVDVSSIDFGYVLPGTSVDRPITFSNTSTVGVITLTGAVLPHSAYSIVSPALPVVLDPGTSTVLTLRYAPGGPDTPTGNVLLQSDSSNGTLSVFVQATTGGQDIRTWEDVLFDAGGDTQELTFDVPDDAISFMIEATTFSESTELGLRLLMGPGNKEYENESLTGPYIWSVQPGIFTAQVPNTDRSDVQLVSGGGTYRMKLLRWSGSAGSCDVRVIIERRPDAATRELATLDLNVFLAAAIAPTAATAENDTTLQTVLSEVSSILSQQGILVGDIDYYDVTDSTYDDVTFSEFGDLLELSSAATETRLNLFFVREAIGGGILGVSPTLGGPSVNGTQLSGVMSLYTTNNPTFVGLVAAHEIGHFLGLAHTAEQGGGHDDIEDTLECPAECTNSHGGYLMHWQAVGGTTVTNGQGLVIRGHPHMTPRLGGGSTLQAKPTAPRQIQVPADVSPDWCATCRCLHRTKVK